MVDPVQTVSPLRGTINFFDKIGLFDVVLPFLLVFTIVFAIFEKTKVLGTEEVGGHKYSKKNLNAVAAFVIAFLVIASSELVEIITTVSANVVIVLFLSVFFLLLVGSFFKEGETVYLEGAWKVTFMIIVFVSIMGIFLDAIKTKDGTSWLEVVGDHLGGGNTGDAVGAIVLLVIIVGFIVFVVKDPSKSGSHGSGQGGDHH